MPFNGTSKLVEALFAFVDQYQPGDNALRSGFDQFLQDLIGAINEQAAYTQSLTGANPDARYLGRIDAVPTTRDDLSPLQEGDWYVSGNAAAGRVNLGYIYDGANFLVMSDFSSVGATGIAMMAAATQAAGRGVLGLGTAATQNSTAFADASVATTIGLALKLADTSGLALPVSGADWDNAHSTHPGTCFLQGNAATANAPEAVNIAAIYTPYDANNGFLLGVAPSTGKVYLRIRSSSAWGAWFTMPSATFAATKGLILVGDGASFVAVAVGADGKVLSADSAEATGVKWGDGPTVIDASLDTGPATAAGITWVGLRNAGLTAGAVGTYTLAKRTSGSGDVAHGSTLAGSSLSPASAIGERSGDSGNVIPTVGSALSGTWRCMGHLDQSAAGSGGGNTIQVTLWMRIA